MAVINVGIGELRVSRSPDLLRTTVGSCVGIIIYDPVKKVGGLAHIMLPKYTGGNKAKFADTGIEELIRVLVKEYGATKKNLAAKIAGGADMFNHGKDKLGILAIGKNNIEAVCNSLKSNRIRLVASDIGKNYGRTIEFDINTQKAKVFTFSLDRQILEL